MHVAKAIHGKTYTTLPELAVTRARATPLGQPADAGCYGRTAGESGDGAITGVGCGVARIGVVAEVAIGLGVSVGTTV